MSPAEQHAYDAERFAAIAASAQPQDWSRPSPVPEWTARDVVGHLLEWLPGFLNQADVTLPPVDAAGDPVAAWRQRTADVQRLLEERGETVFRSRMFDDMPLAAAIDRFYTADIWMHSWDLGRALGQEVDLGEERCAAALEGMAPIDDLLRSSGQFGAKVPVPETASAQDRFVAFIGRDPSWQP